MFCLSKLKFKKVFQDNVFELLGNLRKEMTELKHMMLPGPRNIQRELPNECPILPLRDVEDLVRFENFLLDEEAFNTLCTNLSTIGGNSIKDCTKRVLQKVISNPLSRTCNWKGRGDKLPFSGFLTTLKLIADAVRMHKDFEKATDLEVFDTVKKWLMHSADRDGIRYERRKHIYRLV
ncbi:hypothetical protein JTE90_004358 [Oedothorax gibbosus]|uniref:DUF4806 domain-containing protein n=1 Tax=Oedothorax gibbosus TaxID=931172 RepID=A0AAV6VM34_9ARAC|nr:hypothetical protein JTE90_004358 [Oedothorax gibbosus]